MSRKKETSEETCHNPRNDGGLDQGGSSGNEEKWTDSRFVLNMEVTGLASELNVGEEKETTESEIAPTYFYLSNRMLGEQIGIP